MIRMHRFTVRAAHQSSFSNFNESSTASVGAFIVIIQKGKPGFSAWFWPECEAIANYERLPGSFLVNNNINSLGSVVLIFQPLSQNLRLRAAPRIWHQFWGIFLNFLHFSIHVVLFKTKFFNILGIKIITKYYWKTFDQNIWQFWDTVFLTFRKREGYAQMVEQSDGNFILMFPRNTKIKRRTSG